MATKTADKYKAIGVLADYYADTTQMGMTTANAKDLVDGKSLTAAQIGPEFDYMVAAKLIEKE